MGAHTRRRPVTAKAAGAAAVLAVAGLSVALLGADGDSESPADAGERRTLAPATASASPDDGGETAQPEISARPVTAVPKPTATTASPTPTRSKTAPPAAPSQSAAPTAPAADEPAAPVVPGVVGLTVEQAASALAAAGYGHEVVCQEGFPTGRVASQQPAAGQQWSPGGRVALFVPQGRCRSDRPGRPWQDDD